MAISGLSRASQELLTKKAAVQKAGPQLNPGLGKGSHCLLGGPR